MPKYMMLLHDDPSMFASVSPEEMQKIIESVKGRFLAGLGDHAGTATAYREALSRPCTEPERRFLVRRLRQIGPTYP